MLSPLLSRRILGLRLCALAALCLLAIAVGSAAGPPYDPRPLLDACGPDAQGDFSFAVFGDSYARPPLNDLLKMVAAKSPTLVVTVGDMVNRGTNEDAWHTLSQRAGWFFEKFPTFPVIGNHELVSDAEAGLRNFLRFYALTQANYAFVFRDCKFIILDHQWSPASKSHIAFLRKELADRDSYDHVFVFRHTPFYTVGSKDADEVPSTPTALTRLFSEKRVTAAFCGHDHIYYRTRRDQVTYLTSGVAGAGVYKLTRLTEAAPGDAYMGIASEGDCFLLHVPGQKDRRVDRRGSSPDKWLFAILVQVSGDRVTAKTISMHGEIWDEFDL